MSKFDTGSMLKRNRMHIPRNNAHFPSLNRNFFAGWMMSIKPRAIRTKIQTIGVASDFNNTTIFFLPHRRTVDKTVIQDALIAE